MATTAWLAGVHPGMESALEIVPPHWVGDDELMPGFVLDIATILDVA